MVDGETAATFGFTKIIVSDVDRMVDFYCNVLGMTLVETVEFPTLVEKILASPGHEDGPLLVLFHEYDGPPLEIGNAWGPIGFHVADVSATYARALAAGGRGDVESFEYKDLLVSMFFDPEGHRVELIGPKPA
ncbi:MAG: VOC family protein [Sphingomonadales bacterium]|nr:MAG: VOC family protein [Sphingomonadales bacterium]